MPQLIDFMFHGSGGSDFFVCVCKKWGAHSCVCVRAPTYIVVRDAALCVRAPTYIVVHDAALEEN